LRSGYIHGLSLRSLFVSRTPPLSNKVSSQLGTEPSFTISPERFLVWHIIERAVKDATMERIFMEKKDVKGAIRWLFSDEESPWSFLWNCTVVGVDASIVRGFVKKSIKYGAPVDTRKQRNCSLYKIAAVLSE